MVRPVTRAVGPRFESEVIRQHCLALLVARGDVLGIAGGVLVRTAAYGRWLIIATEPVEFQAAPRHWSIDLFERGERRFAAHWHEATSATGFCDGLTYDFQDAKAQRIWSPRFLNVPAIARQLEGAV